MLLFLVYFLHSSLVNADNSHHDINILLSEMMSEIKDLKVQMTKLEEQMDKISNESPERTQGNRIEKAETDLHTETLKTTKGIDETSQNQVLEKINELETKLEYNTKQITDLSNNTENLLANCTCGNITWGDDTWDACASGPCPFGATCLNVNGNGTEFVCLCLDGNFGQTCSGSAADATFLATSRSVLVVSGGATIIFDDARINSGMN